MNRDAPATPLERWLRQALARLRADDRYRVRRVVEGAHGVELQVDGRRLVNFCSNDYLGLAADRRVAQAARDALARLGTGSGAAALISGYNAEHRALEEALADFTGRPRALLFASGWAANLGVLRALLGRDDTLVADELNHASLIDGGRLSGAAYRRVPHRDLDGFGRALAEAARVPGRVLVASDAVFSMDGDLAPLPELGALCRQHGAAFLVDDAHGFGVLGEGGRGSLHLAPDRDADPDVYMATLGKALGVAGAFVAGSEALVEYLVQRARTWVFSTAPPPALAAAALAALAIMQSEPQRRERLFSNIERFRAGLQAIDLHEVSESAIRNPQSAIATPIQPLILGSESRALALSGHLAQRGFWVAAIRPPTVPPGTSRLRITLSAAHTEAHVDGLLEALGEGLRRLGRQHAA